MSLERKTQWNHFNLLGSLIGFTRGSLKSTETEWFVKSRKQRARERKKWMQPTERTFDQLSATPQQGMRRRKRKEKKKRSWGGNSKDSSDQNMKEWKQSKRSLSFFHKSKVKRSTNDWVRWPIIQPKWTFSGIKWDNEVALLKTFTQWGSISSRWRHWSRMIACYVLA